MPRTRKRPVALLLMRATGSTPSTGSGWLITCADARTSAQQAQAPTRPPATSPQHRPQGTGGEWGLRRRWACVSKRRARRTSKPAACGGAAWPEATAASGAALCRYSSATLPSCGQARTAHTARTACRPRCAVRAALKEKGIEGAAARAAASCGLRRCVPHVLCSGAAPGGWWRARRGWPSG